jgi:hypothetical protein
VATPGPGESAQPPGPGAPLASAAGAIAGAAAVLELSGPPEAALGKDFSMSVGLPSGGDARRAQMELAFDPGLLELADEGSSRAADGGSTAAGRGPVISAAPGRAVVQLEAAQPGQGAAGSIRFRVIAKSPAATQLTLENIVVQDARGRTVPGQTLGPHPLILVQ